LEESYDDCDAKEIFSLKGKAALSLLALLEDDTDEDTRTIFKDMSANLDIAQTLRML
jgi:hypothetical protein